MNELTLLYFLNLAWRRLWAIILAAAVFGACAYSFCSFFATPSYRATASVLVTNGTIITAEPGTTPGSSVSGTDITASLSLANTISDILQTPGIFKQLANVLDGQYHYRELMGRANIKRRGSETLVVDVSFSATTEEEAIRIANSFIELAPEYIMEFIPNSNAAVLANADKAVNTYPRTFTTTIISAFAGALLAFVVAFIFDSLDQTINGEDDFKACFEIPLLGMVPDFENAGVIDTSKGGYKNA